MQATVSVLLVNLNGEALLPTCLDHLRAQSWPREAVEIILVDNGSTDGSVPLVRESYPEVRIIEADRNLGFAAGNNLAAYHAQGEYLALLNNDALAEADWLETLITTARRQQVACVASKMLNEDGTRVDFAGGVMNLYGRAFGLDEGWDVDGWHDTPRDLFFPCGGAMLIQRDVFLQLGGFDERFVAYFEDVDLGWRLWLAGYGVQYEPRAVVRHRAHSTGVRFPVEQRYALSEANALRMTIKNYEDETLWRVLPLSLLLTAKRGVQQAGLDMSSYRLGHQRAAHLPVGQDNEPGMSRVATALLVAMATVADEMPELMKERADVQATRRRSDAEIFRRFPLRADNPLFPWRAVQVTQERLVESLEVPKVVRPYYGSRLLIITHEKVGPKMAGPAVRAWEMAHALAEEFEVVLACPHPVMRASETVRVVGYDPSIPGGADLERFIASVDVVLAMGDLFARLQSLHNLPKPAIVDLYDPFELEKLALSHTVHDTFKTSVDQSIVSDLATHNMLGDFFLCASERQRDLWLGTLLATGRLNSTTYSDDPELRRLIDIVPFGIPAKPPEKRRKVLKGVHPAIAENDRLLLWGGGLWEWFDPLTLVEAIAHIAHERADVKLFFAAGHHFDQTIVAQMPILEQVRDRAATLGLLDSHIFFGDWIPYDERADYLLEADLGVSTHLASIESRFSSRTRLLDYIWAGLPIVTTQGDPLGDLVAERGVGLLVPPGDVTALAEAILMMLEEGMRDTMQPAFAALQEELHWTRVVEPVAQFLRAPRLAPDAGQNVEQIEQLARLEQEVVELREHLEEVRNGRVMRFLNWSHNTIGNMRLPEGLSRLRKSSIRQG